MKRITTSALGIFLFLTLTGGECSRARVESLNAMNQGVVYAQQGRYIDAEKALDKAAAIDGTNDQAHYNLALVFIELRKFDRAKESLTKAIAINGEVAGYHEKLGTILMELEQWNEAKAAFEKAIATDPDLFKAYYKLAQVHERIDDPQTAMTQYTKCIEHGPRFLQAYSELGRLYSEQGFLAQSEQVLAQGLTVAMPGTEEEASAHHLLGTTMAQQNKNDAAIKEFRAALDIVPGMPDALFSLGWTYSQDPKQREEAQRFLKKYLTVAGDDAPAHYVKAAQTKLSDLAAN